MSLAATLQLQLGSLDLQAELDVRPGELLALLGPNGAGKSTVLRCLAGLAPITAGRIAIDDIVVDEPATHSFVEPEHRSIGVVFQDYLLFEHMTVLENVAYGLRARRQPKATAHRVAREWMERVGLGEYCDQRPRALSGGQAQRRAGPRTRHQPACCCSTSRWRHWMQAREPACAATSDGTCSRSTACA